GASLLPVCNGREEGDRSVPLTDREERDLHIEGDQLFDEEALLSLPHLFHRKLPGPRDPGRSLDLTQPLPGGGGDRLHDTRIPEGIAGLCEFLFTRGEG